MAEPFLGEIRLMSFVFPPQGWALCNGQAPADQHQPGLVLAPRHAVRRQRADQLRPAGPAWPGAHPRGQRAHPG
ncbi:tail fiber protein [Nocardioides convexus]|uniref:tail fiber protein n=1 Tax=Nocardioides convexus TaxID=2712224 RepID=UPI0024187246|nr:tail fiber protein [Nocardioides convexus]